MFILSTSTFRVVSGLEYKMARVRMSVGTAEICKYLPLRLWVAVLLILCVCFLFWFVLLSYAIVGKPGAGAAECGEARAKPCMLRGMFRCAMAYVN